MVVADAGPLTALSRIDRLSWLRELFGRILVPEIVVAELRLDEQRPGTVGLALAVRADRWIETAKPSDRSIVTGLGAGESAAIQLAEGLGRVLLIDDRRARTTARKRGVTVLGTGRVLLAAKEKGLAPNVGDALEALRAAGYRLSDDLCSRLLHLAGEA